MPTGVPRVGVGTHTHLPVEETVEQGHQEALERSGRAIFTQRKGLDPSVLIFSLASPLTHCRPGSPGPTLVPCPRCLGAPSDKRAKSPNPGCSWWDLGWEHGDFPCPSHLVGAEHQLEVEPGVHAHVLGEERKHHVVHPKEGDEEQRGLGQPPVESERGPAAP